MLAHLARRGVVRVSSSRSRASTAAPRSAMCAKPFASRIAIRSTPFEARRSIKASMAPPQSLDECVEVLDRRVNSHLDGVPLQEISDTVGHKSTHVTKTVYRHVIVIVPAIRGGARVMDSVFGADDNDEDGDDQRGTTAAPWSLS